MSDQGKPKKRRFGHWVFLNAERIKQLLDTKLDLRAKLAFASFEPLLEDVYADLHGLDWIIIGAQTGTKKKTFEDSWVDRLVYEALVLEIPVFMKDNLKQQGYAGVNWFQDFPDAPKQKVEAQTK